MFPRKKLKLHLILFISLLAASFYSYAQNNASEPLMMTGIASYTVLDNELYVAILYLDKQYENEEAILSASAAKRMDILVTLDKWRQRNFSKTWGRAITLNNDATTQEQLAAPIIQFSRLLKGPLKYGDKITISTDGNDNTTVTINGSILMQSNAKGFFNAMLNTWIGSRPISNEFKQQMLNIDQENPETADILGRYEYIRPMLEIERNAEIKAWAK